MIITSLFQSQPPNPEGCVYCTRGFGLLQGFWKRKGLSVATVQHTSGFTLMGNNDFDNLIIQINNLLQAMKPYQSDIGSKGSAQKKLICLK
ncbi:hypothetical protein [Limnohabitans planktonicus]|uniref:hypothetical protein n=1 Tax=Limnohabitans planktonicus TaxID=540060 RepID=UPI0014025A41|nr:hypothetical protein [Limnohabitans planktonicus]